MSYELSHLKLDVSGPKGNVYSVIGIAKNIVAQVEGDEAAELFSMECLGNVQAVMGLAWSYEDILWLVKRKTGITFVSPHELGIDRALYTIEVPNNYL